MERLYIKGFYKLNLGCDPEFFFSQKGKIVGSESVIPEVISNGDRGKIVQDGVQAELNPTPSQCRESLSYFIGSCFYQLKQSIREKGVGINFSQMIEVPLDEFNRLSDKSKKFGCMPSYNAYKSEIESRITVDPAIDRHRSAGGHIHLGYLGQNDTFHKMVLSEPERIVRMLDILVGNTCVMIDRDRGNKLRRKTYGRAGEYRIQPHGLEYRTLSNFWLQSYQLMSFVFGMARFAVNIVAFNPELEAKILKNVKIKNIESAINNNSFVMARNNFKKIEHIILDCVDENSGNYSGTWPLDKNVIKPFWHFIKTGSKYWFKEDPLEHWSRRYAQNTIPFVPWEHYGWYNFLQVTVTQDMMAKKKTKKK